jgi:hypothetical protein
MTKFWFQGTLGVKRKKSKTLFLTFIIMKAYDDHMFPLQLQMKIIYNHPLAS